MRQDPETRRNRSALHHPAAGLAVVFLHRPAGSRPSHFRPPTDTPNGYSSKGFLVLLVLGTTVLLYLLLTFIPRIDPSGRRSRAGTTFCWSSATASWCSCCSYSPWRSLPLAREHLNAELFGIGFGLLFMMLGNYLPRLPRNFFFGIRTPWTLASEEVWRKPTSCRVAVRPRAAWLIILLVLFGVPMHYVLLGVLLRCGSCPAAFFFYPYFLFRRIQRGRQIPGPDLKHVTLQEYP